MLKQLAVIQFKQFMVTQGEKSLENITLGEINQNVSNKYNFTDLF